MFAILNPSGSDIIIYRVLDTLVGAILAMLANHFLWPFWEFLNTNENIKNSIEANRNYLKQISIAYNNKESASQNYRLARNQAFIEIGNLMASFQRMLQEPKSKQVNTQQIYKLTVINNALLSSAASLGTYIQSHKTTKASKSFNIVFDTIIKNLDYSILLLTDGDEYINTEEILEVSSNQNFSELKKIREKEIATGADINSSDYTLKMQESQLVIEQLIWLTNLSENIIKTTQTLKKQENQTETNLFNISFETKNPEA